MLLSVNPPSLQVDISPSHSDILTHLETQENDKNRLYNKEKEERKREKILDTMQFYVNVNTSTLPNMYSSFCINPRMFSV